MFSLTPKSIINILLTLIISTMKKRISIFGASMLIALSIWAVEKVSQSAIVTTSCGISVTTVSMEAFETYGDWYDYMVDINEMYCGSREFPQYIEP